MTWKSDEKKLSMAQAGNTHSEMPPEDFAVAAAVHLSIPGDGAFKDCI